MKAHQLRSAHDRQAKRARCSCGWQGPWRTTPPTGHRHRDASARHRLASQDYRVHYQEAHQSEEVSH